MFEKIWFFELLTFIKLSAKLPSISYLLISYYGRGLQVKMMIKKE